jgi:hypothetical protein
MTVVEGPAVRREPTALSVTQPPPCWTCPPLRLYSLKSEIPSIYTQYLLLMNYNGADGLDLGGGSKKVDPSVLAG